jgi:hypothetical protein
VGGPPGLRARPAVGAAVRRPGAAGHPGLPDQPDRPAAGLLGPPPTDRRERWVVDARADPGARPGAHREEQELPPVGERGSWWPGPADRRVVAVGAGWPGNRGRRGGVPRDAGRAAAGASTADRRRRLPRRRDGHLAAPRPGREDRPGPGLAPVPAPPGGGRAHPGPGPGLAGAAAVPPPRARASTTRWPGWRRCTTCAWRRPDEGCARAETGPGGTTPWPEGRELRIARRGSSTRSGSVRCRSRGRPSGRPC